MDSEITGRKVKVNKQLRDMTHEGLARIEKIVGRGASAHVIFSSQKHAEIAEVTVNARHHTVVGLAEAPDLSIALRTALDKAEKQAVRWKKKRMVEKKRQTKPLGASLPSLPSEGTLLETSKKISQPAVSNGKRAELHIILVPESMAQRPMTIEEAVKEAESRDREVFVFRDLSGDLKVLHLVRDGFIHLIEVP